MALHRVGVQHCLFLPVLPASPPRRVHVTARYTFVQWRAYRILNHSIFFHPIDIKRFLFVLWPSSVVRFESIDWKIGGTLDLEGVPLWRPNVLHLVQHTDSLGGIFHVRLHFQGIYLSRDV